MIAFNVLPNKNAFVSKDVKLLKIELFNLGDIINPAPFVPSAQALRKICSLALVVTQKVLDVAVFGNQEYCTTGVM